MIPFSVRLMMAWFWEQYHDGLKIFINYLINCEAMPQWKRYEKEIAQKLEKADGIKFTHREDLTR